MKSINYIVSIFRLSTFGALLKEPHYLEKNGLPQKPEDLLEHFFINHSIRKPANQISLLCADGLGIAILTKQLVQQKLDSGVLKILLPDYPMHTMDIGLFYKASAFEQPKVRCFIDFLKEKIH